MNEMYEDEEIRLMMIIKVHCTLYIVIQIRTKQINSYRI